MLLMGAVAGLAESEAPPSVYINGGDFPAPTVFTGDAEAFEAMAPGEVAAYWRDEFADSFLGPARSNRTEFDWERYLAERAESRGLDVADGVTRLESSSRVRGLDWSEDAHALDEAVVISGLASRIRVAYLVVFVAISELHADGRSLSLEHVSSLLGLWPEGATLAWLEDIWTSRGLVTAASLSAWRQESRSRGLAASMSVDALVQHASFLQLEIDVEISTLLEACRTLGLELGFESRDLEQLVAALSLATGTEEKDLLQRLRQAGLISSETEHGLITGTDWAALREAARVRELESRGRSTGLTSVGRSGGPDIRLEKSFEIRTTRRSAVVTYSIRVVNTGTMKAVDLVIADVVPQGMKYVDAFTKGDGIRHRTYRHPATRAVVWRCDELEPGRSITVGFRTRFPI